MKLLGYKYQQSANCTAQGETVAQRAKNGFYRYRGGNGTYIMSKPTKAVFYIETDEQIRHECSVKELIKEVYNSDKITENRTEQFFEDCKLGKYNLGYNEQTNKLYLIH